MATNGSPNSKIGQEIADDLLRFTAFIQDSLDTKTASRIGDAVVEAMLDLISKGISPIQGQGRFPAYKWAAFKNAMRKEKNGILKKIRENHKAFRGQRRLNQRQLLTFQKEMNRLQTSSASGRYPYTKEAIAAGKKPRPVNLYLHGDFLKALQAHVVGFAGSYGIEVGFFAGFRDKNGVDAATKEDGHRAGANGQPSRPTIPIGTEDFVLTIQDAVWQIIEEAIDEAAARGSS